MGASLELFLAVTASLLSMAVLLAGVTLLSRRLVLVRRLRPALYLTAVAAGLRIFGLFETQLSGWNEALEWVLMLLGAIAVLQVAGLYFFDVYLHHQRGVRLPPLIPMVVMGTAYLIAALITFKIAYQSVDVTPLVATSAVTSLVLGLALQPILGNFFSGLVISLEKPFRINDWIQFGTTEGLVTDITWRTTHVRTRENDTLVIPNSQIAADQVTNYHYPHPLHLERIFVGAHYRTPPYRVREALLEAAAVEGVLDKPTPEVHLLDFDESSIRYELRVWIEDHAQKIRIGSRVREAIWEQFRVRGITIPFPIRTLELNPPETPVRVSSRSADPEDWKPTEKEARLFVSAGVDRGKSLALDGRDRTVGRSRQCSLVLNDGHASKEHFTITAHDGGYTLKDLGSHFGTLVNGRAVTETALCDLDRITIGDTEIVFEEHV